MVKSALCHTLVNYLIKIESTTRISMTCFGCNWRCQYPRQNGEPVKCIQDISVEKVWQSVDMALHSRNNESSAWNDA